MNLASRITCDNGQYRQFISTKPWTEVDMMECVILRNSPYWTDCHDFLQMILGALFTGTHVVSDDDSHCVIMLLFARQTCIEFTPSFDDVVHQPYDTSIDIEDVAVRASENNHQSYTSERGFSLTPTGRWETNSWLRCVLDKRILEPTNNHFVAYLPARGTLEDIKRETAAISSSCKKGRKCLK